MTEVVLWLEAYRSVPAYTRPVLIVRARDWVVDVGEYKDGAWQSHGEPVAVKYWADFPPAPPAPDYD